VNDELQTALVKRHRGSAQRRRGALVAALVTTPVPRTIDLDILAEFVRELAVLARTARERGERLYCWVCT